MGLQMEHMVDVVVCVTDFNFIFMYSRMSSDHIHFFLQLRNQLKLYHWQTRVYARHVAVDNILDELDNRIDSFVEIYIGKYGRPKLTGEKTAIRVYNMTEAGASRFVKAAIRYMQGTLSKSLHASDTDLINLRDELLGQLDQLQYLFTLH